MKSATAVILAIASAALSSCAVIPLAQRAMSTEEKRKVRFEASWNGRVGIVRNIPEWHKPVLLETNPLSAGRTEYVIRQSWECRIAIVTDQDSRILSWRYAGAPEKCWEYGGGGF